MISEGSNHPAICEDDGKAQGGRLSTFLALAGGVLLSSYLLALVVYMIAPGFTEHIEPAVASVASRIFAGLEIYSFDRAAPPSGMQYGPLTYGVPGLGILLSGDAIVGAKLACVIAAGLGVGLATCAFLRRAPWRTALIHAGVMAGWLLFFEQWSYMVAPEASLLATVGAAVWCVDLRSEKSAAIAVGVLAGLAVSLKVHMFLPFLPFIGLLWERQRWRGVVTAGVAAAVVAGLPFAFPGVSATGFARALSVAGRHGFSLDTLLATVPAFLLLVAPLGVVFFMALRADRGPFMAGLRRHWAYWTGLALALVIAMMIASKRGAGAGHLIPFAPVLADAMLRLGKGLWEGAAQRRQWWWRPRVQAAGAVSLVAILVFAAYRGQSAVWFLYGARSRDLELVRKDLREVIEALPGRRLAMGFGDGYQYAATWVRPDLVAAGHPYLIEPVALMDLQAAGEEVFPEKALLPSAVDVWLIPKGTQPFSMPNPYGTGAVLPEAFQRRFVEEWRIAGNSRAYDLWAPKPAP